jgi:hypothetical protein
MKKFDAFRKEFEVEIQLNSTPNKVFPLLCPTREYDWIKDWDCELVYSDSGFAEENCIFKTNMQMFGPETWIFMNYEINKGFDAIRFGENILIRWNFKLTEFEGNKTNFKSKFFITATKAEGNEFVKAMTIETPIMLLKGTEKKLNYYFETGQILEE